jgi:type I restriction enzyme M protein
VSSTRHKRVSDILSEIVTLDSQEPKIGKRTYLASVMDFACGSGSLLLNVRKRMGPHGIGRIFGQETYITTYNLARMNMLLHGVRDSEFEIYHGDTLTNDWDMLRETNPAKKPYFDAVVASPPFSYRWEPDEAMGEDERFEELWARPNRHLRTLRSAVCRIRRSPQLSTTGPLPDTYRGGTGAATSPPG